MIQRVLDVGRDLRQLLDRNLAFFVVFLPLVWFVFVVPQGYENSEDGPLPGFPPGGDLSAPSDCYP